MGPYAFHGNQWVSYDDAATIRIKVRADREITVMKLIKQGQDDDYFLKQMSRISVCHLQNQKGENFSFCFY
jgi:hypothetical protein